MTEETTRLLTENKSANAFFSIQEKFTAGIKLTGSEVKSVKLGLINLKSAYVSISMVGKNIKCFLVNSSISPYAKAGYAQKSYDPLRRKELLLTKKELNYLLGKTKQKHLTIVPLNVYTRRGLIKLTIALASGKKQYDRRQDIKRRELDRQVKQIVD